MTNDTIKQDIYINLFFRQNQSVQIDALLLLDYIKHHSPVDLIRQIGESHIPAAFLWCWFQNQWDLSFNLIFGWNFGFPAITIAAFLIWSQSNWRLRIEETNSLVYSRV